MKKKTQKISDSERDQILLNIAKKIFFVDTIETRNSDRLDFYDTAIWSIRDGLREAFIAGQNSVIQNRK